MIKIILRYFRIGDEKGIIELQNDVFDSTRKTNRHKWEWQYINNPQGETKILVYETTNKIIGHLSLMPIILKIQNENILSGKTENGMMHAKHRGFGNHFIKMLKRAVADSRDDMKLVWGLSGPKIIKPQIAAGFCHIGDINQLFKIIDFEKTIKWKFFRARKYNILIKLFASLISFLINITQFFLLPFNKTLKSVTIHEIDKFDKDIDALWDNVQSSYQITIKRSSEFLNWRFIDNPNSSSKIFVAKKNNILIGYIVLGCYQIENDMKIGYVSDLFVDKTEEKALHSLLKKTDEYFQDIQATIISFPYVKGGRDFIYLMKIFKKHGYYFKDKNVSTSFLVNSTYFNEQQTKYVNDIRNWYFTFAFSEGIRF